MKRLVKGALLAAGTAPAISAAPYRTRSHCPVAPVWCESHADRLHAPAARGAVTVGHAGILPQARWQIPANR